MKVLALRAYGSGYRGCLIDKGAYLIFQYTPRLGFKILKSYPRGEFQDYLHFIAVMQKFMSPAAFIVPPAPIQAPTLSELQRIHTLKKGENK